MYNEDGISLHVKIEQMHSSSCGTPTPGHGCDLILKIKLFFPSSMKMATVLLVVLSKDII